MEQNYQKEIKRGIVYLAKHCSQMKKLIEQHPACNISPQNDLFYYLCKSIVSQQLSTKAAKTIFERWLTNFKRKPSPNLVLKLSDEQFQNCGISRQKRNYIRNIANYWKTNKKWLSNITEESNEDIIEKLTSIKGVGEWTVQMLLMFALFRLDVFPIKDLGIQKGLQKIYGLSPQFNSVQLKKIQRKWGNYSTIASWYLWRSLES